MSQMDSMISSIRSSQLLRPFLVGILTLVLLIPIAMIGAQPNLAYLFVLLTNEDGALLVGSIGLFLRTG